MDRNRHADPIRVRLMSQRGPFNEEEFRRRLPGGSLDQGDFIFDLVGDKPADVVVIQNYLKYDTRVTAREGYIWKWDNEPIVATPIARGYDRVYTHLDLPQSTIAHTAPPVLDWWVGKTFDELEGLEPPSKTEKISAIASTKTDIPGHIARHDFLRRVEREVAEVHLFGHGRPRELVDKWDGLAPYEFSIAIENTSKPDYWSEKIADCFLSYTVPLYFGATNIDQYFPKDSYIWLPLDEPDRAVKVIRDTMSSVSWASRLDALHAAREKILKKYSFVGQVGSRVRAEAEQIRAINRTERLVHGRRTKKGGRIRGVGIVGNISARIERNRQRRQGTRSNHDAD